MSPVEENANKELPEEQKDNEQQAKAEREGSDAGLEGAENPEEGQSKFKKIKKILIISIPILLALLGGAYFYFFVLKSKGDAHAPQDTQEQAAALQKSIHSYVDLEPMTVGLLSSANNKEYLRIKITLRLASDKDNPVVLGKVPIIKDSVLSFLRSLRASDFNNSGSTLYLREEIFKRVNKITDPVVVQEVLFQEITVK